MDARSDRLQPQLQAQPVVATAPGKVIIFGEHAVVYGRPAIAVPVTDVQARAEIVVGEPGSGLWLLAADLPAPDGSPGGHRYRLRDAAEGDPLRVIVELALDAFSRAPAFAGRGPDLTGGLDFEPDLLVSVTSTIPIARGLGSGAAVATAVARALAHHFGGSPQPEEISRLVYEVEKLHHGTPSGIDNSVIAYEQPVFFVRGEGIMRLSVEASLSLVIADTGVVSSTREVVGDLRRRWQAQPEHYEGLFDEIGAIARLAKAAIERGDPRAVGQLMNENHELLKTIGVSSLELDTLVEAALAAGALGAKMSGAGWGGNMLALVEPHRAPDVANALREAGAARTIFSEVL
jgi:mevalonate kinase